MGEHKKRKRRTDPPPTLLRKMTAWIAGLISLLPFLWWTWGYLPDRQRRLICQDASVICFDSTAFPVSVIVVFFIDIIVCLCIGCMLYSSRSTPRIWWRNNRRRGRNKIFVQVRTGGLLIAVSGLLVVLLNAVPLLFLQERTQFTGEAVEKVGVFGRKEVIGSYRSLEKTKIWVTRGRHPHIAFQLTFLDGAEARIHIKPAVNLDQGKKLADILRRYGPIETGDTRGYERIANNAEDDQAIVRDILNIHSE